MVKGVKVSIITATYNSAATLGYTLQSLLNQSYTNYEYFIIDGGSEDGTLEIIESFIPMFDGRLRYLSETDLGIYDAWNKGVLMSNGDWITFIGSDDCLYSDSLMSYMSFIEARPDCNFFSSKCLLISKDRRPIRVYGSPWTKKMFTYCTIAHVGSFHHRLLFDGDSFNINYKISGDYDFLLRKRNLIIPFFFSKITADVLNTGISGGNIFLVSLERTKVKIRNGVRPVLLCYFDFALTIVKFYVRKYF